MNSPIQTPLGNPVLSQEDLAALARQHVNVATQILPVAAQQTSFAQTLSDEPVPVAAELPSVSAAGIVPPCVHVSRTADAPAVLELHSVACLFCDALVNHDDFPPQLNDLLVDAVRRRCHISRNPGGACPATQLVINFVGPRANKLARLRSIRANHGAASAVFLMALAKTTTDSSEDDRVWLLQQLGLPTD